MDRELIIQELDFKAVRSSGAGGQNVNKVASKVVLSYNLQESKALTDEEKLLATTNLAYRLTNDGVLILNCDEDRSQLRNKDIVIKRFIQIMDNALIVPKKRKPTRIPKSVIKKRLKNKKTLSEKKQLRKPPEY
ncbi:aminoacyl-tRNA hydrolase [Flavobacterium salilacus subsp. salilacus]|uniref:alternative ribosome rescue aminoacyl-tRNA hydrolase ArfB n=1 Tax=Flavobacterium TaxID=237 RepID=UPI001074AB5C|nr:MULTISPECIES: alternative ribosome rescue aminoacyl-tRNA hydrolase ArfB [Flavobacterium]KAF2515768.1 aminoacyl-tRNA hydrolase [Flavobacterium salilacus subsp. salilacus]MBE1615432.1 aminoacyl-tRNA hydrolase [Flavobacterium sp. SaA2.13]